MSQAHIHLMITHLPIFGVLLGLLVLVQGIWKKNDQTIIAAYTVLIVSALGAVTAYLTGGEARATLKQFAQVSGHAIHEHRDAARFALWGSILMGVMAIVSIVITLRRKNLTRIFAFIMLFLSLFVWTIVARTGWLGGQIRHTEIVGDTTAAQDSTEGRP